MRALVAKSELQRRKLDINAVVRDVLDLVRSEAQHNHVTVRTHLDAGVPEILADPVQLQQVLLNLIMNGIEAMAAITDRPKLLVIGTEADAGGVAVVVEDSGVGLEMTTADRVFDPFFTTKTKGLGMGLSICRSIVEAHGGQLRALPRSPHGAVFRFTLPLSANATDVGAGVTSDDFHLLTQVDRGPGIAPTA